MTLKPSDIPPEVVVELNAGRRESRNLAERLALDPIVLLGNAVPRARPLAERLIEPGDKVTKVNVKIGKALHDTLGRDGYTPLLDHQSDTVRGWAAYVIGERKDLDLFRRLTLVKPLADDRNSHVREWAWLAVRPHIKYEIERAIGILEDWVTDESPNIRRFAVEATRPRGVWCEHIQKLKDRPEIAETILTPLHADEAEYVQLSVGNWLNDASKTRPDWVLNITERWLGKSDSEATAAIVKRARRSITGRKY